MKRPNKTGSVYKRKDGKWVAALADSNGKRRSIYTHTRREAEVALSAALTSVQDGRTPTDGSVTLEKFAQSWLDTIKGSVKPRTLETYQDCLKRFILPSLGLMELSQITYARCQEWVAELRQPKYRRHETEPYTLSPATIRLAASVLKSCLRHAVRLSLIPANPAQELILPRNGHREMPIPTKRQVKRLLLRTVHRKLKAAIALAATMGLRKGEILALTWDEIDLEVGTLHVRGTLTKVEGEWVVTPPKTEKSRRTLKLTQAAGDALSAVERSDGRIIGWQPQELHVRFKTALKKANVPDVPFHSLRHFYATMLLVQGVQPKVVGDTLGHASIRTTMDVYSTVLDSLKQQTAETMDEILGLED